MSTTRSSSNPVLLLVHEGELVDVRAIADGLGAEIVEQRGSITAEELRGPFDLVVATPQRMLDLHLEPGVARAQTRRIAIAESESRTLRTRLRGAGIDILVRRPVHPAVLRTLLLETLYRGPEKRRSPRVAVGAPVRIRCGWRQRPAILADLSLGGCRLFAGHAPTPGRTLTLYVPADVAEGGAFSLRARVLRCTRPHAAPPDTYAVTAAFENLDRRSVTRVQETVRAFEYGPATVADGDADLRRAEEAAEAPTAVERPIPSQLCSERRGQPRRALDQRVIALGAQAAQVLIGTDISMGGMRVTRHPGLAVGEPLQLAIHTGSSRVPIVVRARVYRDDGDRGLVLRFDELPDDVRDALERMLESLPLTAPSDGDEDADSGIVVSEILQRAAG